MRQREVQDDGNVRWVCVQAFAGTSSSVDDVAADLAESDEGTVPVVCTPSGGAQTVRLELPRDWEERVSDAELLEAIAAARAS